MYFPRPSLLALLAPLTAVTAPWALPAQTATPPPASAAAADSAERVVVTGSPLDRSAFDLAQPVSQLSGLELKSKQATTLGEALDGEPGISQSGFTHGASRPIIRGQADNRIRVLNNGTDIFDVSNLSPDHEPSVEPLISQSIEVVRGPATILYGSSAIGGVVNIIDNRIPMAVPDHGYAGELVGRMGSVDFERSGAFTLDLAVTRHLVFHLDGTRQDTDDLQVPGYALSPRLRKGLAPAQIARGDRFGGDPRHDVPNTYVRTKDFGVGVSYVWDKGFIGTSFSQYLSVYGVPDDPEVDDPAETPEGTRLDITKRRWDIRASVEDPFPYFQTVNFKINATDYKHREIDGASTIGSTFLTSGFDSRLEFVHKPLGILEGSLGVQVLFKDLAVGGDGAFLQPTRTVQPAGFIFEEVKLLGGNPGPAPAPVLHGKDGKDTAPFEAAPPWNPSLRLQAGGRIEYSYESVRSDDPLLTSLQPGDGKVNEFLPLSVSAGLVYEFLPDTAAALTLSYSERAPTPEELYARGVHDATFQYIIGNPDLGKEKNFGVDFSLRRRVGLVTGALSGFYNRYTDFIDFAPQAGSVEGNRIFDYAPINADFYGGEALLDFHLLPPTLTRPIAPPDGKSVRARITGQGDDDQVTNPNDLYLQFKADYVHAEDRDSGASLPRITPLRVGIGLGYTSERLSLKVEGVRVNHQYHTAQFETSTPGYTLLNASASYRFPWQLGHGINPVTSEVFLRGTNLTNEEARNHQSFLKDVLPLPGRNVLGGVRLTF